MGPIPSKLELGKDRGFELVKGHVGGGDSQQAPGTARVGMEILLAA
jgi:hypothetical protein